MASNTNHGNAKKMSLEEFLGDESLGETVWDENEINLDAINNTTDIDLFKHSKNKTNDARGHSYGNNNNNNNSYYQRDNNMDMDDDSNGMIDGPPYIVKFSHLPPRFSNRDIEELFQAKYTKFIKFKLFWELNINPSIDTLKSGSKFEQNFKRDSKVAFVELYTARDLHKIINFWKEPLRDIYEINTDIAVFENFKEYISKSELLKGPEFDASRPYIEHKSKPTPFGSAKPVDTQSKTLEIEKKMDELHIEDTTTLRRLSENDGKLGSLASLINQPIPHNNDTQNHEETSQEKPKITILKKPTLSYSEVLQKSVEETKKDRSSSPSNVYSISQTPENNIHSAPVESTSLDNAIDDDNVVEGETTNPNTESVNTNTVETDSNPTETKYKNNDRDSNRPRRGGYNNNRGYHRGDYNNRGGHNNYNNNERGGKGGYSNRGNYSNNRNQRYNKEYNGTSTDDKNDKAETQSYSLFKPASSFLGDNSPDNRDRTFNNNHHDGYNNHRGNDRGRGGRGGRGRGRGRGGFNRGGHSNYRGRSEA
ncbi:polymerase suppressor [Maudiozyma exigua]|uniref:Polymerase suppressor n=1 Tax=Maudiozyma exigua TaxID=34358 RepID=A0A9P7BCV0_MAUEX|nr:polymerase suppressor [Kazachstania exigua]